MLNKVEEIEFKNEAEVVPPEVSINGPAFDDRKVVEDCRQLKVEVEVEVMEVEVILLPPSVRNSLDVGERKVQGLLSWFLSFFCILANKPVACNERKELITSI